MGRRGHIFDAHDPNAGALKGPDGRFSSGARALDEYIDRPQSLLHSLSGRVITGALRCEGS